jgi:hypothetical protein
MSHIQEQFEAFHRDNPLVWVWFKSFANRAVHAGKVSHYSADAILHRIRWYVDIETTGAGEADGKPLKINNNYAACYARLYAQTYPQHAGFFRMRKSQVDNQIVGSAPRHDAAVNA